MAKLQDAQRVARWVEVKVYSVRRHAYGQHYTCFRYGNPFLTSSEGDAVNFMRSMQATFPGEKYKLHIHTITVPIY